MENSVLFLSNMYLSRPQFIPDLRAIRRHLVVGKQQEVSLELMAWSTDGH